MALKKIGIIGDGGWGTALALHLAKNGHKVTLWSAFPDYAKQVRRRGVNFKYLPGFKLPKKIKISSDLKSSVEENEVILNAVPTPFIRHVFKNMTKFNLKGKVFLNVSKGIENNSLLLPSQIMRLYIKKEPIAALSGPTHAEEVAKGLPSCVVIAHNQDKVSRMLQKIFTAKNFRVYTSKDVLGVQLGGAVKNVIAIAGGIIDGLEYGDNTKSALLARGTAEIAKLGTVMGAKQETFFGLSGLGDLVTTCFSPHGRNRAVGEQLGRGKSLKSILSKMEMVAEGVKTAKSVHALRKKYKIELPISEQVYKVLYNNKSPKKALFELMMRTPRAE